MHLQSMEGTAISDHWVMALAIASYVKLGTN
jgi:hypothetical protein